MSEHHVRKRHVFGSTERDHSFPASIKWWSEDYTFGGRPRGAGFLWSIRLPKTEVNLRRETSGAMPLEESTQRSTL